MPDSHDFRGVDAQPGERADKLALGHGGGSQQEGAAGGVGLGKDVVLSVEVAEVLRELEGVLSEIGRLRSGDALR